MVLGYDKQRPSEPNYNNFVTKLVGGLEKIACDGLSLMIYGSFVRGDYTPGRSDIDAVLTFPHDVVIEKSLMREISIILYQALMGNNVPFQVAPLDATTMRDGRFNSFTDDFRDYFQSEGRVVVGPDYRGEMVFLGAKTGEESTLSHNLRKSRQALLFSEHDRSEDYRRFLERFNSALNVVSRGSKQVLYLVDGHLRKNRFSALEAIREVFPGINAEPLERIRDLYENLGRLDAIYRKPDELMGVWNSAVTFLEEVIRAYIHKFPRKTKP